MGNYSDIFSSILYYFLRVFFEVKYLGLVNYGFFTLCRNYSHLILEHVREKKSYVVSFYVTVILNSNG